MPGQKLRQVLIAGIEQNSEIAPVDNVTDRTQLFYLLDEIAEVGNHFRRSTRKIDRWNFGVREPIDDPVDGLTRHDFLPLRPGVHVTMHAGEVAKLSHVHLQHFSLGVTQK